MPFLSDNFTTASSVLLQAYNAAWTKITGFSTDDLVVDVEGRLRVANGQIMGSYFYSSTRTSEDYAVEVDITRAADGGDRSSGVIARANAAGNFYMVRYREGVGLQAYKFTGGASAPIGTDYPVTWAVGSTHKLKLEVSGSNPTAVKVYVDGGATAVITHNDSTSPHTSGGPGVWMNNTASTNGPMTDAITASYLAVADSTAPALTGVVTISALTSTSYTASWPAATDNVAVTGYEYSRNGGTTWTQLGNVLTVNITGATPSSTEQFQVRAMDAAGNRSAALSAAVTLAASAVITITINDIRNVNGPLPNTTLPNVVVLDRATRAAVLALANQTTNGSAALVIASTNLSAGGAYMVAAWNADGSAAGIWPATAA